MKISNDKPCRPATLSLKQLETMQAIRMFLWRHEYPPTVRELAQITGVTSTAAFARLRLLEKRKLVWRGQGARRLKFTSLGLASLQAAEEAQDDDAS